MTPAPEFLEKFDRLPTGGYGATAYGARWRITKTVMAGGRSQKLEAEELGGQRYVSFNLYRLQGGEALLKPCEMSVETVVAFMEEVVAD